MKGKSEKERETMIETLLEVELVSIWLSSLPQSLLLDDQRLVSEEKKNTQLLCMPQQLPCVTQLLCQLSKIACLQYQPLKISHQSTLIQQVNQQGSRLLKEININKYSMQGKYYPDQ
jgi:hypothetical protein